MLSWSHKRNTVAGREREQVRRSSKIVAGTWESLKRTIVGLIFTQEVAAGVSCALRRLDLSLLFL